jgi:acetyl esterase/lipase
MRHLLLLLLCTCAPAAVTPAGWAEIFLAGDGNRDQRLDPAEVERILQVANPLLAGMADRVLPRLDRDGDGCLSPQEVGADREAVEPDPLPAGTRCLRDLPYRGGASVRDGLQMLDCYAPADASQAPVLVYIHGGGWAIGDKSRLKEKVNWWCGQGGILVSINYRLSPAVRHPAHIEDVAAALDWVNLHIADYGGDPRRILLMGHSAGAHLAALVGSDPRWLGATGRTPEGLAGVILLDGAGYDIPTHMAEVGQRMLEIYRLPFTDDPAIQADASPILQLQAASGFRPPPFLITHSRMRSDSSSQSKALAAALIAAGGQAEVAAFAKDHKHMNDDVGVAGDPLTTAIQAFLDGL